MSKNKIKAVEFQAIMAGNFFNLGLFLILLLRDDMLGQNAVLLSWLGAYIAAVLMSFEGVDLFSGNAYQNWAFFLSTLAGLALCVGGSLFALTRVLGWY